MSTEFNIESLLEGTLDELADAPTFEPFHVGAHVVTVHFEGQDGKLVVNKHPAVKIKMKLIRTEELANPQDDTPQKPGSEAEVLYMLDNDMGQGSLKKIAAVFQEKFGTRTLRETLDAAKGTECLVMTSVRTNKEKTQKYTDIKEISVL
jgi:hypothetical protein